MKKSLFSLLLLGSIITAAAGSDHGAHDENHRKTQCAADFYWQHACGWLRRFDGFGQRWRLGADVAAGVIYS